MSCEICKRNSCVKSFHSLSEQGDFDKMQELLKNPQDSIDELQSRITELEQQVNALESGRDYLSGEYEILQKKNDELEQQLAQEREANRWIPETESIPKEQGVYLVSFHNGVFGWFDCCELYFTPNLVFNNLIEHGATHWRKIQEVK